MKPTTIANLTDQRISTRSVTADQGPLTDMDMDSSSRHGGRHRDSNATLEAHALLRTFSCFECDCELYSGRPKARWYDMIYDIIVMLS